MKIGMQTWGSHGDIRPFLALAEGLQAAGHEVRLVITCVDSDEYAATLSECGVKIELVASPVFSPEQGEIIGRTIYSTRNPMAQTASIFRLGYAPAEDAMFAAAQDLCADSDLLVGHYVMHPLQIAAEQAGLPYVSVLLSHAGIPSAYNHPLGEHVFGKLGNRFLWWLTKLALNKILLPYPNRLRQQVGLPVTDDMMRKVWISDQLNLVAISPQICEKQDDWSETLQVCGFLDMPNLSLEGNLPEDLDEFLGAGDSPIYATFGSWMSKDIHYQRENLRLLSDAVLLAGCRAIIQAPSWRECGFDCSNQIMYVAATPHHAVFPLCRAIVHHGGAGTTQSATLAGKPSIIVAHISEQEHWGQELRRIGIAGATIKRRQLTPKVLAEQINHVLNTPGLQVNASRIGEAMRQENGVARAVQLINQKFAMGLMSNTAGIFNRDVN